MRRTMLSLVWAGVVLAAAAGVALLVNPVAGAAVVLLMPWHLSDDNDGRKGGLR